MAEKATSRKRSTRQAVAEAVAEAEKTAAERKEAEATPATHRSQGCRGRCRCGRCHLQRRRSAVGRGAQVDDHAYAHPACRPHGRRGRQVQPDSPRCIAAGRRTQGNLRDPAIGLYARRPARYAPAEAGIGQVTRRKDNSTARSRRPAAEWERATSCAEQKPRNATLPNRNAGSAVRGTNTSPANSSTRDRAGDDLAKAEKELAEREDAIRRPVGGTRNRSYGLHEQELAELRSVSGLPDQLKACAEDRPPSPKQPNGSSSSTKVGLRVAAARVGGEKRPFHEDRRGWSGPPRIRPNSLPGSKSNWKKLANKSRKLPSAHDRALPAPKQLLRCSNSWPTRSARAARPSGKRASQRPVAFTERGEGRRHPASELPPLTRVGDEQAVRTQHVLRPAW